MDSNRLAVALEFLNEGKPFVVEGLKLGVISNSEMIVTGWSAYTNASFLTKQKALEELDGMIALFSHILRESEGLNKFSKGKTVKFILALNYGMGSMGICSKIDDGKIEWQLDLDK